MKKFTLGFIFTPDFSQVLLMHKNRPDWQKGKLNGVGGRIEEGEESAACIVREVAEETGVTTKEEDWKRFGVIQGTNWHVDVYALQYAGDKNDFSTTTDEEIVWFDIKNLPENIIGNLAWMIPMAKESFKDTSMQEASVTYR